MRHALAVMTLLSSLTGCADDPSDTVTAPEAVAEAAAAKDLFWTALRAGRTEDVPAARDAMIAAFANNPNDDELPRWIGFGGVIEGAPTDQGEGQVPDGMPDAGQAERLDESIAWIETAVEISRDYHVKSYNSGFLGGVLYNRGMQLGNAADAQRARDILERLVRELPAFGYATRGDVMNRAAVGTEDWATALESYFRFFEHCTGEKLDRQNPDIRVVLRRPFASPDSTCGNWSHAAHGIQGFLVMFGDSLVKNNQPAAARPVFEIISETEGYADWEYKSVVDERLAADLVARAAQFQSANQMETQRLPFGVDCFGCHAQR